MKSPGSFHKLLERVMQELLDAHKQEISEVQKSATESVKDANPKESHMSTECSNQIHLDSASLNKFAGASFHGEGSSFSPMMPTPPRVFESRWEEPRKPMLGDDFSDIDCSLFFGEDVHEGCDVSVETPGFKLQHGESWVTRTSVCNLPYWFRFDINNLPQDYLESLQIQFNRLDRELEGRIHLDQCLHMLEVCTSIELSKKDLIDSLNDFRSIRHEFGEAVDANDPSQTIDTLDFIDFAFLMARDDLNDSDSLHGDAPAKVSKIQKVFIEYNTQQINLAQEAQERIRKHKRVMNYLELFPAPIIFVNSIVMGLRVDIAPDSNVWEFLDVAFLLFYVLEACVKVWVFGLKVYCCGPGKGWNWFDVACICLSLIDLFMTYAMPLLASGDELQLVGEFMMVKTLRLARVVRLVKALNYPIFKELKAMVDGVVSGIRVVLWGIVLLIATVFCIGLAMNHVLGGDMPEFSSLDASMLTTFRCFTDGCIDADGKPLHERLRQKHGWLAMCLYMIAYMCVVVGVFNLIMATFLGDVVSNSQNRKQEELCYNTWRSLVSLQAAFVRMICAGNEHSERLISARLQAKVEIQSKHNMEEAYRMLPPNLTISRSVFRRWLLDEDFLSVLEDAGIETFNTSQLFDVLDADMSGHLSLTELRDGLLRLRGPITKSDVVAVRLSMRVAIEIIKAMGNGDTRSSVKVAGCTGEGRSTEHVPSRLSSKSLFLL